MRLRTVPLLLVLALAFGPLVAGVASSETKVGSNVDVRTTVALKIAEAEAQAGDLEGAHKTANTIEDDCVLPDALEAVAAAQVRAGDARGALAWALAMDSPHHKSSVLLGVVKGVKEILEQKSSTREILGFRLFLLSEEKGCY